MNGRILVSLVLNIIITFTEFIAGILAGSLSLLSDALHNLSDVFVLLITYVARKISEKEADITKTFGYRRIEILAAFVNLMVLIGIGFYLIVEGILKIISPAEVNSKLIIWIGLLSVVINAMSASHLHGGFLRSLNVKSAYLHLLTDMFTSIAVVLGGLIIEYTDYYIIDPILSIFIASFIFYSSRDSFKKVYRILMNFAPEGVDYEKIKSIFTSIPEIEGFHHFHIWQLNENEIHLEAHIDFKENVELRKATEIIETLEKKIKDIGINHVTFQPEFHPNHPRELIRKMEIGNHDHRHSH